ncbi:MAG TPA: hypothetical protein VHA35_00635 [Dongiaceae bacterium]|nr:hypothetical protein [Dongiaceae bacterium]
MKSGVLELRPTQRRWRDLGKRRLSLGLAVAPVAPVLIGLLLLLLLGGPFLLNAAAMAAGAIFAAAIGWALIAGWAYLLLIPRSRGVLGRIECLLLGVLAASSLPVAVDLLANAVDWLSAGPDSAASADDFVDLLDEGPSDLAITLVLAIILSPFGLLGGWIFWRVGVRPTVTTVGDLAPVFD